MSPIGLQQQILRTLSHFPPSVTIILGTLGSAAGYVLAAAYHGGYIQGLGSHPSLHAMPVHETPLHLALGTIGVVTNFFLWFDSGPQALAFVVVVALIATGAMLLPNGVDWLDQRLQGPRAHVRHRLRSRLRPGPLALLERCLFCFVVLVGLLLMCLLVSWIVVNIVLTFERAGESRAAEELRSKRSDAFMRATWTDSSGMPHEGEQLLCSSATLVCAIHENGTTYTVLFSQLTRSASRLR